MDKNFNKKEFEKDTGKIYYDFLQKKNLELQLNLSTKKERLTLINQLMNNLMKEKNTVEEEIKRLEREAEEISKSFLNLKENANQ